MEHYLSHSSFILPWVRQCTMNGSLNIIFNFDLVLKHKERNCLVCGSLVVCVTNVDNLSCERVTYKNEGSCCYGKLIVIHLYIYILWDNLIFSDRLHCAFPHVCVFFFFFFFFFFCAWTVTSHGFTVHALFSTVHVLFSTVHALFTY